MKRLEKAQKIAGILGELYPNPPVPLDHSNPFTLLVAVLLSAQTTDARVNLVTPALFKGSETAKKMCRLSEKQILEHIRTCGLAPRKAKAIYQLCRILVNEHGGEVPADFESLEALPGVGHKTASVVMAQAFGVPAFPVDTHIHRLATRWGLTNGKSVEKTEEDLKKVLDSLDSVWVVLWVEEGKTKTTWFYKEPLNQEFPGWKELEEMLDKFDMK